MRSEKLERFYKRVKELGAKLIDFAEREGYSPEELAAAVEGLSVSCRACLPAQIDAQMDMARREFLRRIRNEGPETGYA